MSKAAIQGFSADNFTCAVIGAGGLGCNIAVHLAGAGIKRLILCDFDKVSRANLNRQFLYTNEDIGIKKVFAAEKRLKAYAPETDISALDIKLSENNIPEELKDCDMIFFAADNKKARECISDFCTKNKIPLMLGGIDGFYGKTYLYIPDETPSPKEAGMLDKRKPSANISAAAGVIGSLQTAIGIQYLLTKDNTLGGRLTVFDKDCFSTLEIKQRKRKRDDKA